MFDVVGNVLGRYYDSEEHEEFVKSRDVYKSVDECLENIINKYDQCKRDDVNKELLSVFNSGESWGLIQGIGLGIKIVMDCTGK